MKIMVERKVIIENLKSILDSKISSMTSNDALGLLIRPLVTRAADKGIYKIDKLMKFIEDENGMIDIKGILTEMCDNLITAKAKEYSQYIDGLIIGDGKIQIDLPLINKSIILDSSDIEEFKNSFA